MDLYLCGDGGKDAGGDHAVCLKHIYLSLCFYAVYVSGHGSIHTINIYVFIYQLASVHFSTEFHMLT